MVTYRSKINFLPTYLENIFSLKYFSLTSIFTSPQQLPMCLTSIYISPTIASVLNEYFYISPTIANVLNEYFYISPTLPICLNKLLSYLNYRFRNHGTFNVPFKICRRENQVIAIIAVAYFYRFYVMHNHHRYLPFRVLNFFQYCQFC